MTLTGGESPGRWGPREAAWGLVAGVAGTLGLLVGCTVAVAGGAGGAMPPLALLGILMALGCAARFVERGAWRHPWAKFSALGGLIQLSCWCQATRRGRRRMRKGGRVAGVDDNDVCCYWGARDAFWEVIGCVTFSPKAIFSFRKSLQFFFSEKRKTRRFSSVYFSSRNQMGGKYQAKFEKF
jgi:hypothetical protein